MVPDFRLQVVPAAAAAAAAACNDTSPVLEGLCGACSEAAKSFQCSGAELDEFSSDKCPAYAVSISMLVVTVVLGLVPLSVRFLGCLFEDRGTDDRERAGAAVRPDAREHFHEATEVVVPPEQPAPRAEPEVGIALSGGGIRSASFSSGVVQAYMYHQREPGGRAYAQKPFDVLSTVSGGGYLGTAFINWLQRKRGNWEDFSKFFNRFRKRAGYVIGFHDHGLWRAMLDFIVLVAAIFGYFFLYISRHAAMAVFIARLLLLNETEEILCKSVRDPFVAFLITIAAYVLLRWILSLIFTKYDPNKRSCRDRGSAVHIALQTIVHVSFGVFSTLCLVVIFARLLMDLNGQKDPARSTLPFLGSFLLSGLGSGLVVSLLSSGALAIGYGYVVAILHEMEACLTCRNDFDRCGMAWPLDCRVGDYREAKYVVVLMITLLFLIHPALLELHSTWLHYFYRWRLRMAFYDGKWNEKRPQFPPRTGVCPKLYTGVTISQWLFAFPEYGDRHPDDKGYVFAGYSDDRIVFFKNPFIGVTSNAAGADGVDTQRAAGRNARRGGNGGGDVELGRNDDDGQGPRAPNTGEVNRQDALLQGAENPTYARVPGPQNHTGNYEDEYGTMPQRSDAEHPLFLAEKDRGAQFAHDAKDLDKMMAISGAAVAHELGEAGVSINKFVHGCLSVISLSFGRWIHVGRVPAGLDRREKRWFWIAAMWLLIAGWFVVSTIISSDNESSWPVLVTFAFFLFFLVFGSALASMCYSHRSGFWGFWVGIFWSLPFMQSARILFRLDVKRKASANRTPGIEAGNIIPDVPPAIYVSDGGHSENLAVLPLVYERVDLIIIADGEQDGRDGKTQTCAGLEHFLSYLYREYRDLVDTHMFDAFGGQDGPNGGNGFHANLSISLEQFARTPKDRFFVFGIRIKDQNRANGRLKDMVVLYLKPRVFDAASRVSDEERGRQLLEMEGDLNEQSLSRWEKVKRWCGRPTCGSCCMKCAPGSFPNHSTGFQFFSQTLSEEYAVAGALALDDAVKFAREEMEDPTNAKPWRGEKAQKELQRFFKKEQGNAPSTSAGNSA